MPVNRPDGSPDVEATYARFEARLEQGDQEGALADARWYWHNALELGVGQGGVRLSYFLSRLEALVDVFEPARVFVDEERERLRALIRAQELDHDGFHDLMRLTSVFGSSDESIVSDFELIEREMPGLAPLIAQVHAHEFFALGALEVFERHRPDIDSWIEQTQTITAYNEVMYALGRGARREDLGAHGRELYDALVGHMGSSEALDALVETDPEHLERNRAMERSMFDDQAVRWREILLALGEHDEAARVEAFRVGHGYGADE